MYKRKNSRAGIDMFLVALSDIIAFFAFLPGGLIMFYKEWQADLDNMYSYASLRREPLIGVIIAALILSVLGIAISGKNVYFKLIGSASIIFLTQWYINISIPHDELEEVLLSPLKEQCYSWLETIPIIAIGLCILLGILNFFLRGNNELSLVLSRKNQSVILAIILFCIIVIPYILRPLITIWL